MPNKITEPDDFLKLHTKNLGVLRMSSFKWVVRGKQVQNRK